MRFSPRPHPFPILRAHAALHCCFLSRLRRPRHHRALDDGDGAQEHRLLTSTRSAASFQAENLFDAIEISMLSAAAEGPAAAWPRQGRYRVGFSAWPWLQAAPVDTVAGWTSQSSAGLRFGAPGERCTLESCLWGSGAV